MSRHKTITIYYRMSNNAGRDTAESCVDLTMLAGIADDVLQNGSSSGYVTPNSRKAYLYQLLKKLAILHGYKDVRFISAGVKEIEQWQKDTFR